MPIYSLGTLNTTALTAPDLYIQKIPPQTLYPNGVATDILGMVGVGSWGPVNSPIIPAIGTFGTNQLRKYDLSSAIYIASQLNATNIRAVRVTDGNDTAASVAVKDTSGTVTGVTLTAFYTGTQGNSISAAITTGTKPSTYKLTVYMTGYTSEVFDNIEGSGATFWANLVSAVNNGQNGIRGASQFVVATVGTSTAAPSTTASFTLSGGADGASSVTDSTLIGTDGNTPSARKGMYALRGTGAQVLNLIDLTDSTVWATANTFVDQEGMYYHTQGTAGASYSTVSSSLQTAGVDSPATKALVGDWAYWYDPINGVNRMMAPATFTSAKMAAMSPHLSLLNEPLGNIVGTQRTSQNQPYSTGETGAVATSRLDVITNPCPGGYYYGCRTGRNCSSDPTRNGDNYTRMTNYLAATLAASFGWVIGKPQTTDLRHKAKAAIESFLQGLLDQGMIGDVNGGPAYSVVLDASNNSESRVTQGYMQADVQVKYLSIVWFFIVNLEGGQTVTVRQVQNA